MNKKLRMKPPSTRLTPISTHYRNHIWNLTLFTARRVHTKTSFGVTWLRAAVKNIPTTFNAHGRVKLIRDIIIVIRGPRYPHLSRSIQGVARRRLLCGARYIHLRKRPIICANISFGRVIDVISSDQSNSLISPSCPVN